MTHRSAIVITARDVFKFSIPYMSNGSHQVSHGSFQYLCSHVIQCYIRVDQYTRHQTWTNRVCRYMKKIQQHWRMSRMLNTCELRSNTRQHQCNRCHQIHYHDIRHYKDTHKNLFRHNILLRYYSYELDFLYHIHLYSHISYHHPYILSGKNIHRSLLYRCNQHQNDTHKSSLFFEMDSKFESERQT